MSPISVTESGTVIENNLMQPLNAHLPIFLTESPIVTSVNPLHPLNAYDGIFITFSPMFKVESDAQPLNAEVPVTEFPIAVQLVALKFTVVNPLQLLNASPIFLTELPIVTSVSPLQPEKAYKQMLITELGNVNELVISWQFLKA